MENNMCCRATRERRQGLENWNWRIKCMGDMTNDSGAGDQLPKPGNVTRLHSFAHSLRRPNFLNRSRGTFWVAAARQLDTLDSTHESVSNQNTGYILIFGLFATHQNLQSLGWFSRAPWRSATSKCYSNINKQILDT